MHGARGFSQLKGKILFTLAEGAAHREPAFRLSIEKCGGRFTSHMCTKHIALPAFTLAEVLITLGIIGVVAAITLPTLIQNYQKMVLKNQYKKVYSTFFNAIKLIQTENEGPIHCFYRQTPLCKTVCVGEINEYGGCSQYICEDGSPRPANNDSVNIDCKALYDKMFNKKFKVAKFCKDNALDNGCITSDYKGTDIVKKENNPDYITQYKEAGFGDENIKKRFPAWVLADGTLFMRYGLISNTTPIFLIDINGHKKPNKWGYDIFTFQFRGDETNGITEIRPINYATEKGGLASDKMYSSMYD